MRYNIAEVSVFHTCNFSCGYCNFATSGAVADGGDMAPFKDKAYIDKVFDFFESHSTPEQKWILHLTGGEPMMMPNAGYFSRRFIEAGHKLAYNTNLALPIEKNGWMQDNPPEGISALVVSLHQQALNQFPVILARVKALREAGYRIYVRMVAHPKFIPRFNELDAAFREVGVTFSVNPLYSPNFPRGYSDPEKQEILKHTKLFYEAIRLNGGLDMRGRGCRAGDKLISVALGVSGGGNVYPCISTATEAHHMGNIFDGSVKMIKDEHRCLRSDQCCSCAVHFVNGVLDQVDDQESYENALTGVADSIADTWQDWFAERNVKTKFHGAVPQGTKRGESELVIKVKPRRHSPDLRGNLLFPLQAIDVPAPETWNVESSTVAGHDASDKAFELSSLPVKFQMLAHTPSFRLGLGRYQIDCDIKLRRGGLALGVLDVAANSWITQQTKVSSGRLRLDFTLPNAERDVRLVISAYNWVGKGGVTTATIERPKLSRVADPTAHLRATASSKLQTATRQIALNARTRSFEARLQILDRMGKAAQSARRSGWPLPRTFQIIDHQAAGYACRAVISLQSPNGSRQLLTANAGHDTLSLIDIDNGRLGRSRTIKLPERSTPIYLSPLYQPDGRAGALVSLFNFDESGTLFDRSCLFAISDLNQAAECGSIELNGDVQVLLERPGYWGYRGSAVIQDGSQLRIAAVDRDRSAFFLLDGSIAADRLHLTSQELELGGDCEPIGVAIAAPPGQAPNFLISLRNTEEVLSVGVQAGAPVLQHRVAVTGLSRSSVATGRFDASGAPYAAIALWGGPPTDLITPHRGSVAVGRVDAAEGLVDIQYLPAGVHPTDVAAGDFDGDGIQELAVLNYGTGLTHEDRGRPGGVEFFKLIKGSWRRMGGVPVANPRIAAVMDIDQDGVDELVVSLFFENRIAVIKRI